MDWFIRYKNSEACITHVPQVNDIRDITGGAVEKRPQRLTYVPPRISSGSFPGITTETFTEDTQLWKASVLYYGTMIGELNKGRYRNIMDMNAYLGGFAAALVNDPVWVMNVVPSDAKHNTLGVIYERGLIGTYQNWYAPTFV